MSKKYTIKPDPKELNAIISDFHDLTYVKGCKPSSLNPFLQEKFNRFEFLLGACFPHHVKDPALEVIASKFKKYDSIIKFVCKEENVGFIPLIDLMNDSLLFDGLHPNTKGHELIFDRVLEYLNKL